MKIIKKNVYYCDFCKKKSLAKGHLIKHELHCTNNPHRVCRMCEGKNNIGQISAALKLRFELNLGDIAGQYCEWKGSPITLQEIRTLTGDCPMCILSVLRQTKLFYDCCELEKFDYKKEAEQSLAEKNRNGADINTLWF